MSIGGQSHTKLGPKEEQEGYYFDASVPAAAADGRIGLMFRPNSNLIPPLKSWMSVLKLPSEVLAMLIPGGRPVVATIVAVWGSAPRFTATRPSWVGRVKLGGVASR